MFAFCNVICGSVKSTFAKMPDVSPDEAVQIKLRRGTVLGSELEETLVKYILKMEAMFYGLTRTDIKRMAYSRRTKWLKTPVWGITDCWEGLKTLCL